MFPPSEPWRPALRWEAPAGQLLDRVVNALPADQTWEFIVFGSAPLQLGLDASFVSADVDIIAGTGSDETERQLDAARLLKGQQEFYVEVVPL